MLAEDRLNTIVSMVQQAGSVTVPELADALGVTASTIRRDLQTLDRAHRIAKVHGGATSLERAHVTRDLTISERSDLHNDDKERICARAAALVEPESFVYIDSGSTTLRLIEHLPHLESVTYVTDSVLHAQHLAVRGMRTVVLGGEVAELLGDALLDALNARLEELCLSPVRVRRPASADDGLIGMAAHITRMEVDALLEEE